MSNLNKFLQSFNENNTDKNDTNENINKNTNKKLNEIKDRCELENSVKNQNSTILNKAGRPIKTTNINQRKDLSNQNLFNIKEENIDLKPEIKNNTVEDKTQKRTIKFIKKENNDQSSFEPYKPQNRRKTEREIYIENREKEQKVFRELEQDLINARKKNDYEKVTDSKDFIDLNSKNREIKHSHSSIEVNAPETLKNNVSEQKLERMFIESETKIQFRDKWYEIYNKAVNSDKKTIINNKIRNGRFRIQDDGKLEILADFNTYGKSSKELLNMNWKL